MEGCHKIMKYLLIGFNFLTLIIGACAIGLGIWALVSDYGAEDMQVITGSDLYMAGCIICIVGGSIVVIISFLGCCGAWKENRCLLGIYFVIMLLFLILFVVCAAIGFFFRDDLEEELSKEMESTLKTKYGVDVANNEDNKAVTDVWNKIQEELDCCGVSGGLNSDKSWFLWQSSKWFTQQAASGGSSANYQYVPTSCCNVGGGTPLATDDCQKIKTGTPNIAPQTNNTQVTVDNPALFETGCLDKVKDKIEDHIVAIAVVTVVAFCVMFLCVVFSVCVCMEAKRKDMVV